LPKDEQLLDRAEAGEIQKRQLWENACIRKQIAKRELGESFSINDHIRGMVCLLLGFGVKRKSLYLAQSGQAAPMDTAGYVQKKNRNVNYARHNNTAYRFKRQKILIMRSVKEWNRQNPSTESA
jgi:hypothetical protein